MAKKVAAMVKLQIIGRAGNPVTAGRTGTGSARGQHNGILQGF